MGLQESSRKHRVRVHSGLGPNQPKRSDRAIVLRRGWCSLPYRARVMGAGRFARPMRERPVFFHRHQQKGHSAGLRHNRRFAHRGAREELCPDLGPAQNHRPQRQLCANGVRREPGRRQLPRQEGQLHRERTYEDRCPAVSSLCVRGADGLTNQLHRWIAASQGEAAKERPDLCGTSSRQVLQPRLFVQRCGGGQSVAKRSGMRCAERLSERHVVWLGR